MTNRTKHSAKPIAPDHATQLVMDQLLAEVDSLNPVVARLLPELFRKICWAIASTWSNHTFPALALPVTQGLAQEATVTTLTIMNRDLSPI